jgi:hypothetical protein
MNAIPPAVPPPRSGSATASKDLAAKALPGDRLTGIKTAVHAYGAALSRALAADDLIERLEAVASVVLATEDLADMTKSLAETARKALAATMLDTGATTIRIPTHSVTVSEGQRRVLINGDVPPDYMRQPPAAPDKALIARALKDGFPVPGATLSNGSDPVVTFRSASK